MTTPGQSTGATGVSAPSGYTADTGSVASQATAIHNAAESAEDKMSDLTSVAVSEQRFGNEHTQ